MKTLIKKATEKGLDRLRSILSTMKVSGYKTDKQLTSNLKWFYDNLHVHNRRHKDYVEAIDLIEALNLIKK